MVAVIPLAIGTMVYPTLKEIDPQFESVKFVLENKASVATATIVGAAGACTGYFMGAITAVTFTPLLPVVAGLSIGVGIGYAVLEYLTPKVENRYFPESLKDHEIAGPLARVAVTGAVSTAAVSYKGIACAYYISSSMSQIFITPNIPGIESFEGSTKILVEDFGTLAVMGGGYGLSLIPAVAKVGSVASAGLRYGTAANAGYQVVDNINYAYTQEDSMTVNVAGTTAIVVGSYYASNIPFVLTAANAINEFVNADEVILMTLLNNVNDRVLEKTGDPMLDTVNSDGSSTAKTAIAAGMGLKKGATPYTKTKVVAAAVKPAIKLSPDGFEKANLTSHETTPYARVALTYMADAPSTWVASAEKHMFAESERLMKANGIAPAQAKAKKFDDVNALVRSNDLKPGDDKKISLWNSLRDTNVVISSFTSSCFKTVGTSMGAKATEIWKANFVVPSLQRFDKKMKQYCSGGVSDFCTYVTASALPKCVKQYVAYKITEGKSLELSDDTVNAIQDAIGDVEYLDKKGEDTFCSFVVKDAIRNKEGLDEPSKLKEQDISTSFFASLSSRQKADFQKFYGQFASIVQFSKGTKLSLSLIDYGINMFSPIKHNENLPSLTFAEMLLLAQADSIIHNKEIGNTYIFAGSVRAITTGMDDYYLPAVGRTRFSTPLKILPIVAGVGYLGNEVSGKFGKISAKAKAKKDLAEQDKFLEKAKDLLHKGWQELYQSHQDGAFDEKKVAAMNAEDVTKSMHLCDNFAGFAGRFDINQINSSAVKEAMAEIKLGCTHVQEAYNKLEHIPRSTFDTALKVIDNIVCDTFNPSVEPMDRLIEAARACTVAKRFEGTKTFDCVCTKVDTAIVELRKQLSHEHLNELPVETAGNGVIADVE